MRLTALGAELCKVICVCNLRSLGSPASQWDLRWSAGAHFLLQLATATWGCNYCNYCSFKCLTANFIAAHRHRRVCHSHWNGTKQTSSQINHLARRPILHPLFYFTFTATFPLVFPLFFFFIYIYFSFRALVLSAMWRKIMLYILLPRIAADRWADTCEWWLYGWQLKCFQFYGKLKFIGLKYKYFLHKKLD